MSAPDFGMACPACGLNGYYCGCTKCDLCGEPFDADCEGDTRETNSCQNCCDKDMAEAKLHAHPPRPETVHDYLVAKGRAREL